MTQTDPIYLNISAEIRFLLNSSSEHKDFVGVYNIKEEKDQQTNSGTLRKEGIFTYKKSSLIHMRYIPKASRG